MFPFIEKEVWAFSFNGHFTFWLVYVLMTQLELEEIELISYIFVRVSCDCLIFLVSRRCVVRSRVLVRPCVKISSCCCSTRHVKNWISSTSTICCRSLFYLKLALFQFGPLLMEKYLWVLLMLHKFKGFIFLATQSCNQTSRTIMLFRLILRQKMAQQD